MDKTYTSDKEIMYMASDFLPLNHKVISCSLHSNPGSDLTTPYTNQSEHAQRFGYASLSAEALCFKNGDLSAIWKYSLKLTTWV